MVKTVRDFLRKSLSPSAYHFCSSNFWKVYYYWPRLVASRFVERRAKVRGASGKHTSEFIGRLSNINIFTPTKMCLVMTAYGSDKGNGWHTYTPIYSALLSKRKNEPLRIFELGLGTNNPNVTSNMGAFGQPGASLRGWKDLFPLSYVYGADIDTDILFEESRIKTFYCDQLDSSSVRNLWSQSEMKHGMDIIIEDGLHTYDANMSFLYGSLEYLRPGGFYVIEDIAGDEVERWHGQLEQLTQQFSSYEFAFLEMANPLNDINDNNMLIVSKSRSSR